MPFYSEVSGNLYIYETLTVNGTGSAEFAPNVSGSAFYYGDIITTGSSAAADDANTILATQVFS
jgi:hypothetical protein